MAQKHKPQQANLVYLCQVMNAVDSILLLVHGIRNSEQPHICGTRQSIVQILRLDDDLETLPSRIYLADGLL